MESSHSKKCDIAIPDILKGDNNNSNPLKDIADSVKNPLHNMIEIFALIPESVKRDFEACYKRDALGRLPGEKYMENEIAPKLKHTLLDSLIEGKSTRRSTIFNEVV